MSGWSWGMAAAIFGGTIAGRATWDLIAVIARHRKREKEEKK